MPTPQPTQSHLLNRLLQRQISQLESENATLKVRVARLESRVTDSTAKHRALNGNAADDVARATSESQTITRETERAAKLMVQHLQHSEHRLLTVAKELRGEQTRLEQAIRGLYSTLETLPSQSKRDAAALIRSAHAHQENLLAQLAELYDDNGLLRHSETETRLHARRLEEQATAHRRQLTRAVERDQRLHTVRMTHAHDKVQEAAKLLASNTDSILKLLAALQTQPRGVEASADAVSPSVHRGRISSPHHEDKVLETARKGIEEEVGPAPAPAVKATLPVAHAAFDTGNYRAITKDGIVLVPAKSRSLLHIGILLAMLVIVVVVLFTLL